MSSPPLAPSPTHYKERRAAAEQIAHYLEALHEPSWGPVLRDWLSRYDGLERYLWPEEDPVMEVRNLLERYVKDGRSLEPEQFAKDLAGLPFCLAAARHDEGGPRWSPFQDGQFKAWTRGRMVKVWDAPEPQPTRDMIQAWLLLRFCRTRTQLQ
jgi:hypothetical protein